MMSTKVPFMAGVPINALISRIADVRDIKTASISIRLNRSLVSVVTVQVMAVDPGDTVIAVFFALDSSVFAKIES